MILTRISRLQICPLSIFRNKAQMVPMDLNTGFKGLALIQGQICNPEFLFERMGSKMLFVFQWLCRSHPVHMWTKTCLRLVIESSKTSP